MIFGTIFLRTAIGFRWFSRAALASVAIVNEQHKESLEGFNKEGTDAPPAPPPPPPPRLQEVLMCLFGVFHLGFSKLLCDLKCYICGLKLELGKSVRQD